MNPDYKSHDQEWPKKIQEYVKNPVELYKYPSKVGILVMMSICLVFWKFSSVHFFPGDYLVK